MRTRVHELEVPRTVISLASDTSRSGGMAYMKAFGHDGTTIVTAVSQCVKDARISGREGSKRAA